VRLGANELRSIVTGRLRIPADRAASGRFGIADDQGRVELVTRALLIDHPEGRLLVDPGPPEEGEGIDPRRWGTVAAHDLPSILAAVSVEPASIGHVLLTHLHPDHAGAAFRARDDRLLPAFPNARIYLPGVNAEAARREGSDGGYRRQETDALRQVGWIALEGAGQILPGLEVWVTNGHATGMQGLTLRGEGEALLVVSDLLPTIAHLRLPGSAGHDRHPELVQVERRRLLAQALEERSWIFLYHDPRHVAVRLGGTVARPIVREEVVF